ncbi:MAG: hypothetical protein MUE97_02410 [Phycisphaerales bacterium]|nr:hypothetical protein [Phycisphaerales bacterium]
MKTPHRTALSLLAALATSTAALAQQDVNALADANFAPMPAVEALASEGLPAAPAVMPTAKPLSAVAGLRLADVPFVSLPAVDHAALIADDLATRRTPLRVGIARDIDVPADAGLWTVLPDGRLFWALDLRCEGATALRAELTDLDLPEGAEVLAYSPSNSRNISTIYTGRGQAGTGSQYTPIIFGDTLRLEMTLPAGSLPVRPFALRTMQHIYRDLPLAWAEARRAMAQQFPQAAPKSAPQSAPAGTPTPRSTPVSTPRGGGGDFGGGSGTCNNDVACFATYANAARAVAIYYLSGPGGTGQCSGSLISTTSNDLTPYFLTAAHCGVTATSAPSLDAYWLWQTPTCTGANPDRGSVPQTTGAVVVANRAVSDGTLARLTGLLPGGLFYLGWSSATPTANVSVVGIHHPSGDVKKISFGSTALTATCGASAAQSSNLAESLRVNWTNGVTEGGSSGSPLIRVDNQQIIGVLSCGASACGNPASLQNDTYGRFASFFPDIQTALAGFPDDSFFPNQTCATARLLTPTSPSQTYSNLVVKAVAQDWFRISIPAGGTFNSTATFNPTTANVDLRLLTACAGTPVATSLTTTGTETITWVNTSAAAVDVLLNVSITGTGPLNTYSLTIGTPPANPDSCATATLLTPGTPQTGTTVGATYTAADVAAAPTCVVTSAQTRPDVWYRYTAPIAGTLALDTCGSAIDTVLTAYAGCGSGNAQIACNDDTTTGPCAGAGSSSFLSLSLTAGQSIRLRVAGYTAATGAFNLRSTFTPVTPPPSNDECAGAQLVSAGVTTFNTLFATNSGPSETLCNSFGSSQIGRDVWYRFVAPAAGTLMAETCGTTWDTRIAVYSTCPGSTADTAIDCNDDLSGAACSPANNLASRVIRPLTSGQTILLRVGGFINSSGISASGAGSLNVMFSPSGPDACTPSDVAGPNQSVGADGVLTADDIIVFLGWYFAGDARADIAGANQAPAADGQFTADDIIVFLGRYFQGC